MSGDPVAFNNTSAVDICSCVYLIIYQALHSPTFRPHAHSIKEFQEITGELIIFGLSPYNDYHLFEIINNAALEKCIFFYYNDSECERIKLLLPQLNAEKRLVFQSAKKFWEGL